MLKTLLLFLDAVSDWRYAGHRGWANSCCIQRTNWQPHQGQRPPRYLQITLSALQFSDMVFYIGATPLLKFIHTIYVQYLHCIVFLQCTYSYIILYYDICALSHVLTNGKCAVNIVYYIISNNNNHNNNIDFKKSFWICKIFSFTTLWHLIKKQERQINIWRKKAICFSCFLCICGPDWACRPVKRWAPQSWQI